MSSPFRTARIAGRTSRTCDVGARHRRWGLGVLAGFAMVAAGAAWAGNANPMPSLPSGLDVELQEMLIDIKPDGLMTYARFRFVAPDISEDDAPDFAARIADMEFLCNIYALPRVAVTPEPVNRIVISFADRVVAFGQPDPDATQFFEVFSIQGDTCIWEEF